MKTLIIATIFVIIIMAMGMTTQPDYAEYDLLITETEHIGDSARSYLKEISRANDSLVNIHFPKDAEK